MTVPPVSPAARRFTLSVDRTHLPSAATALGVALVGAAVAVSALHSRATGDLDLSNFTMGVLGTVGLLGLAVCARWWLPGSEQRAALVSWPGTAGVVGVGLMLAVLIDDDPVSVYVLGGVVVALSVAGYLATRATAFTLSTVAGAALLYSQGFNDVVDTDTVFDPTTNDDNTFMLTAAAIVLFVVAATLIGWLVPRTRVLTGIVIGVGGLVAMTFLFEFLTISRAFSSFGEGDFHSPYVNDIWVTLLCCACLAAFWLACSLGTGHLGFRILALVITVEAVPVTAFALAVSHPTWWEVVACGLGGLVLIGVALASRAAPETSGVAVQLLAAVDLGPEIPVMDGYQLRMRQVTIEPGGVFGPVHDHQGRPGTVYVLSGTITDHRDGIATEYGPGLGWPEDRNTLHYLENNGTVPAVEVSVDVVRNE